MLTPEIHEIIEKIVTSLGYELVACEWQPLKGGNILRILIDTDHGVTVDDCTRVSKQLNATLDAAEDLVFSGYYLEVSSPGLDRPLIRLEHFQRFVGRKIKVKIKEPVNNRRNFAGELISVQEAKITIKLINENEETAVIPIEQIEKANLVPEF